MTYVSKNYSKNDFAVDYKAAYERVQAEMNEFAKQEAAKLGFTSTATASTLPDLKWAQFHPGDRMALLNAARDAVRRDLNVETPEKVAEYFDGYLKIVRGY